MRIVSFLDGFGVAGWISLEKPQNCIDKIHSSDADDRLALDQSQKLDSFNLRFGRYLYTSGAAESRAQTKSSLPRGVCSGIAPFGFALAIDWRLAIDHWRVCQGRRS